MALLLFTQPALPAHCEPTTDFLHRFSSAFHVCVPTPLAFTSNLLGGLSILAWLFAQLPQIYKNWSIASTSGLSIFFLVEWCLGDLSNLFGALFTHQAPWQVTIGCYYVFVDLCLVFQWIWYERLKHGRLFRTSRPTKSPRDDDSDNLERVVIHPNTIIHESQPSGPKIIFRAPTFDNSQAEHPPSEKKPQPTHQVRLPSASFALPSPSPKTLILLACLLHLVTASPTHDPHKHHSAPSTNPLENAGTVLSWLSTALYLFSRLPQLYQNYRRKSTAGLSPHLFLAAFSGNLFYSAALVTNPRAWGDFGPWGANGWVDERGSERAVWVAAALPFFLGAAGVLGLDASVGFQFWVYGERERQGKVLDDRGEGQGEASRWRRVSGWMRGWVPSMSEGTASVDGGERESLLGDQRGYGTA